MKLSLFIILIFLTSGATAQEVIDINYDGSTDKRGRSAAHQEIMDKAVTESSLQYIKEIIGEEKTNRNKSLINNKIVKNSGKYILFIKGGKLEKDPELAQQKMSVQIKMSLKALKTLLLREGLLYQLEGPPKVLPMITIMDRVNSQGFGWWHQKPSKDRSFLVEQVKSLHKQIKVNLRDKGFYGMAPIKRKLGRSVPEVFQAERPKKEDFLFLGEYFKSSIIVRGNVIIKNLRNASSAFKIDVKLEALHSTNGRVIGEVIRSYETETGPFRLVVNKKLIEVKEKISNDLAIQLFDAWKKGTFGASLLKLTMRSSMSHKKLEQFKKLVLIKVRDIKSLRERMIESGKVTYEIDSSSNSQKLANYFSKHKFSKFKVEVQDIRTDGLEIKVRAL